MRAVSPGIHSEIVPERNGFLNRLPPSAWASRACIGFSVAQIGPMHSQPAKPTRKLRMVAEHSDGDRTSEGIAFQGGRLVHVRRHGRKVIATPITLGQSALIEANLLAQTERYPDGDWDPVARQTWLRMFAAVLR